MAERRQNRLIFISPLSVQQPEEKGGSCMNSEILCENPADFERNDFLSDRNPFDTRDLSKSSLGWEMFRCALRLFCLWLISLFLLAALDEPYRIYVISLMFAESCITLTLAVSYLCVSRSMKKQAIENYPAVISQKSKNNRLSPTAVFLNRHARPEAVIIAPYPAETNFSCSVTGRSQVFRHPSAAGIKHSALPQRFCSCSQLCSDLRNPSGPEGSGFRIWPDFQ